MRFMVNNRSLAYTERVKTLPIIAFVLLFTIACGDSTTVPVSAGQLAVDRDVTALYINWTALPDNPLDEASRIETGRSITRLQPDLILLTGLTEDNGACTNCPPSTEIQQLVPGYILSCAPNAHACVAIGKDLEISGCASGVCQGSLPAKAPDADWRCPSTASLHEAQVLWPNGDLVHLVLADLPVGRPPLPASLYDNADSLDTESQVNAEYKAEWRLEHCRAEAFRHIFQGSLNETAALNTQNNSVLIGQLGFDPYVQLEDGDRVPDDFLVWDGFVSTNNAGDAPTPYTYLSGVDTGTANPTQRSADPTPNMEEERTAHAVSTAGVSGVCMPLDGETPSAIEDIENTPVDGPNGHLRDFAIVCRLATSN